MDWIAGRMRLGFNSLNVFRQPWQLFWVIFWSITSWLLGLSTNLLVFASLGLQLSLWVGLLLFVVLQAGVALPSSPGRIGVFHYLTLITLLFFSVGKEAALGCGFLLHLVVIISSQGDYIGQGKTYRFGGTDMVAHRNNRGVQVSAGGYNFQFGGPGGTFLTAREYHDAKRLPFSGESPGIEIMGNGRGCNTIAGQFVVWELATKGNEVIRMAIDFTHRRDGKGPPFYGKVRINSNYY